MGGGGGYEKLVCCHCQHCTLIAAANLPRPTANAHWLQSFNSWPYVSGRRSAPDCHIKIDMFQIKNLDLT